MECGYTSKAADHTFNHFIKLCIKSTEAYTQSSRKQCITKETGLNGAIKNENENVQRTEKTGKSGKGGGKMK